MAEKEIRKYIECGLATENEYELLKYIMKDVDFEDVQARRLGYLTFLYHAGDLTQEQYHNTEIYRQAKQDGRI